MSHGNDCGCPNCMEFGGERSFDEQREPTLTERALQKIVRLEDMSGKESLHFESLGQGRAEEGAR